MYASALASTSIKLKNLWLRPWLWEYLMKKDVFQTCIPAFPNQEMSYQSVGDLHTNTLIKYVLSAAHNHVLYLTLMENCIFILSYVREHQSMKFVNFYGLCIFLS